jgi:hypothetical protein
MPLFHACLCLSLQWKRLDVGFTGLLWCTGAPKASYRPVVLMHGLGSVSVCLCVWRALTCVVS